MNILERIIITETIDNCLNEMAVSLSKRCNLSQDQAMMLIAMRAIENLSSMAPGSVEELVTTKVRVDLAAMSGDSLAQSIATHVIAMERFGQENADRQSKNKN